MRLSIFGRHDEMLREQLLQNRLRTIGRAIVRLGVVSYRMIRNRRVFGLACLVATAVLAACGGGGGGSSVPTTGGGGGTGGGTVTVTPTPGVVATATAPAIAAGQALTQFKITVPTAAGSSSKARKPQFVDPATKAISLTLLTTDGVAAIGATAQGPYPLAAGATGCTPVTVTPIVCTISIAAPVGKDIFLANTFSDAAGTVALGSGAIQVAVVANATNGASLVLTGSVASVIMASNNGQNSDTLWDGNGAFEPVTQQIFNFYSDAKARHAAGSRKPLTVSTPAPIPAERLILIAQDSQGNVILSPTTYNQDITVTLHTNGYSANSTLADVPPAGLGCTGSSTSVDGGSIAVCSPYDTVTLSLIPTVFSSTQYGCIPGSYCGYYYINFPYVTSSLPSAPTTVLATFPYTVEVGPTPTPTSTPQATLPVTAQ